MTWAAKSSAKLVKPVVRQLMALIQRDQRAALDVAGGIIKPAAGYLPDIVNYAFARVEIKQFPGVLLTPLGTAFDEDEDGTVHQFIKIACVVAVQHQDPEVLAELLEDYMLAVYLLFEAIGPADWPAALTLTHRKFTGGAMTTAGVPAGKVKKLFVNSHDYSEIRGLRDGFVMAGPMDLTVELEET